MQIDMRVMELLSSKLCHDLVSPVSAINNGVELIEDIGGSVVDEAMKLIGNSAVTAARRLRLYRMAYGRAGSDDSLAIKDVRQVAEHYLAGGKVSLVWADGEVSEACVSQRGYMKLLLNIIVLGEEILPYGGVITIRNGGAEGACRAEIVGRNAQLNLQLQEALEGSTAVDELTPRSIHAYVTGKVAENFGLKVTHDHAIPDRLDLTLSMPAAPALVVTEGDSAAQSKAEAEIIPMNVKPLVNVY